VFRGTVPSLGSRGEQVKRHGKNQVHYQYKHSDESRRAPAVGHQGRGHGGDKHHYHRARPELQTHRCWADAVTEQYQHRGDEERFGMRSQARCPRSGPADFYAHRKTPRPFPPRRLPTTMNPTNAGVIPKATAACLRLMMGSKTAVRFSQTEIFKTVPTSDWYHRCRTQIAAAMRISGSTLA
jgi:hypothetical protein